MYFVPNGNICGSHDSNDIMNDVVCVNDVTSTEIPMKGALQVFHDILQHSRPDILTACVTIASLCFLS